MISAIPAASYSNWTETFDLQVLFFRLTLDSATEFLFGDSVNSQTTAMKARAKGTEEKHFAYAFDRSQWLLM